MCPREQLALVRSKDLSTDPTVPCQRIFAAAGLAAYDVSGVVANQAVALRSRRMGRFLQRDSTLKRVLRRAMPLDAGAGPHAARLDECQTFTYPPFSDAQRTALDELYAEDLRKLREAYGIDVRTKCTLAAREQRSRVACSASQPEWLRSA